MWEGGRMSRDNVDNLFLPVIGVWEDNEVVEWMRKWGYSLSLFFETASRGLLNAPRSFRLLNLRDPSNLDPIRECERIITNSGQPFATSRFVATFEVDGPDKSTEKFEVSKLQNALPWFNQCHSVLSESPRRSLTVADVPLRIYTFTTSNRDKSDILRRFNPFPELKKVVEQKDIIVNYHVEFSGSTISFNGWTCDLSQVEKDLSASLFPDHPRASMSTELFGFLSGLVTNCVLLTDERIVANLADIDKAAKRKQPLFGFGKKEKAHMAEFEQGVRIVQVVCDGIYRGKDELATTYLRRLRSLQNPNLSAFGDFLWCKWWISKPKTWDDLAPSEVIADFQRLFKAEGPIFPVMKDELVIDVVHVFCESVLSRDLLRIIENILELPVFSFSTKAICYERLAGYCIKEHWTRSGLKYLYRAFVGYRKLSSIGHALRCAAFIHHLGLFAVGADPNTCFISGCNNVANLMMTVDQRSCVNSGILKILSVIAKLLRECDDFEIVPLLFIYLACYAKDGRTQWKMSSRYLDAINAQAGNKNISKWLSNLTLPVFRIKNSIEIFDFGSPESFGYERDTRFSECLKIWEKKSRSMLFHASSWGKKKDTTINITCGEELRFRFLAKRKFANFPLHVANIHLIVKEEHRDEKAQRLIWTIDQDPQEVNWHARRFVDRPVETKEPQEKIEVKSISVNFPETELEQQIDLSLICHAPATFRVTGIAFVMWEYSTFFLPIEKYHFACFDKEPTLNVQFLDLPEMLCESEVRDFRIIIKNIGDACLGRLILVHDAPYKIKLPVDPAKVDSGIATVPILKDRTQGIRPNEELELGASIRGQASDTIIHFVWLFEAQKPYRLRYYCQKFVVRAASAHRLNGTLVCDSKQPMKRLIFVDVAADSEDVIVREAQVDNAIFSVKPLLDGELNDKVIVEPGQKKGMILEETGTTELTRDAFVDKNSLGVVLSHVDSRSIPFQHLIPATGPRIPFRFQIEAPSQVSLSGQFQTVDVIFKVQNLSTEPQINFCVEAKPVKNHATWTGIFTHKRPVVHPGEVIEFKFNLIVVRPGIINIATFEVQCAHSIIPTTFYHYITVTKS